MNDKIEKSFLDEYSDDFNEYVENQRFLTWSKKAKYKDISKKIEDIKLKYPSVTKFLEDGKFEVLYEEELKALKKILQLESRLDVIEEIEIFKLGMKENYIYLQSMDMLKNYREAQNG